MIRKAMLLALVQTGLLFGVTAGYCAADHKTDSDMSQETTIRLPEPDLKIGMKLYDALRLRASSREFSSREVEDAVLSSVLWAADGINRPEEGRHTAPSAMNRQSVSIYVCRADGTYLWDAASNMLVKKTGKDIRAHVKNAQPGTDDFPVALLLVGDNAKFDAQATAAAMEMVVLDAAYISQNINLACTALGLNNVPRVNMDKDSIREALGLAPTQFPLVNNILGWPR